MLGRVQAAVAVAFAGAVDSKCLIFTLFEITCYPRTRPHCPLFTLLDQDHILDAANLL